MCQISTKRNSSKSSKTHQAEPKTINNTYVATIVKIVSQIPIARNSFCILFYSWDTRFIRNIWWIIKYLFLFQLQSELPFYSMPTSIQA